MPKNKFIIIYDQDDEEKFFSDHTNLENAVNWYDNLIKKGFAARIKKGGKVVKIEEIDKARIKLGRDKK